MNIHKNARLTPHSRADLVRRVEAGQPIAAVAAAFGVSIRTVRKWVERFRSEGPEGLKDRSSRPHRLRQPTPETVVAEVERLRRQRLTGKQIAAELGISPATVSRILRRLGLNRISALEPAEPVRRYERAHPGELIHIDIKKLGRFDRGRPPHHRRPPAPEPRRGIRQGKAWGAGWEFVHVASTTPRAWPSPRSCPTRRRRARSPSCGPPSPTTQASASQVARVMTDNGSCYKSFAFRDACRDLGLRHIRTRPYTPKTNGKAERFIQTALREWAYAQAYPTSDRRADELPRWLHRYNWHRPHGSLNSKPPISRLALTEDNLLRLHS